MSQSSKTMRWLLVSIGVALIAALAVTVVSPTNAQAQAGSESSISLVVSPQAADQPFRTLAVALDAGDFPLAGLGITLHFDTDQVAVGSCAVSEAGACNVDGNRVLASVFNLNRLNDNDQLLTVSFEPIGTAATTDFDLTVDTAISRDGLALPEIVVAPIEVELSAQHYGSLTGVVVAEESATALYSIDICVVHDETQNNECTISSGLGSWRIDDLPVGGYTVVARDLTGVYALASTIATVNVDQVATAPDISMAFATGNEEAADVVDSDADADGDAGPVPIPPARPVEVIVYEASVAGRVTAVDTGAPLEAMQVCATQPLVLHQSCATTDANGVFALADLSTGNYWIAVIDPLGNYQGNPKLVGVVGDRVSRTGVEIRLAHVAG